MNARVKNIILQALVWILLIAFLSVSMSFVGGKRSSLICTDVEINISEAHEFIDETEVKDILAKSNLFLPGFICDSIDLDEIEKNLEKHNQVKSVETFLTVDGKLVINIAQRKPVLRVFNVDGDSFYIDEDGKLIPTSSKYTPRVLVATGRIKGSNKEYKSCIPNSVSSGDFAVLQLFQIYQFAERINNDPFMFAMVDQIFVNNEFQIELVPRVSDWTIVIGDTEDTEGKFAKLKSFLKVVPYPDGWDMYKTINLSFKDQIVCTKKTNI